ncbi:MULTISPECIES: GtrA family protein [Paenibacillus]|uniref:GtrA/DPMS transmembrane domain-containing protein n=1 Tax=Paenibacillus odorifer TaxID=189426 RepID=A0A1R0Z8D7_9BACL|nr:GtrA family protein [Paenibacillus odorifer]OME64373.1 hypothetical protein BSK65_28780 [Paenibacillus odorifer]
MTLKKQLMRFGVTGCSAVLTDSFIYYLLLNIWSTSISKGMSFLCGAGISFLLNKLWTFEATQNTSSHIWKFSVLYLGTLSINILMNKLTLSLFPSMYMIAFLVATGTSMLLNFIGQKWWVFKNDKVVGDHSLLQ